MTQKTQRQQPLVFFFATRGGGYTVEATTSLSLSLSLSLSVSLTYALFTTLQKIIDNSHSKDMCPKSYLYIYDFLAYLHLCPSNRFGTDRGRFYNEPVLCIFHPFPSGGTCFPTSLSLSLSLCASCSFLYVGSSSSRMFLALPQ